MKMVINLYCASWIPNYDSEKSRYE